MTKTLYSLVLAIILSGCANLPSVQACDNVTYQRQGNYWRVMMTDCRVLPAKDPISMELLP